jgi:hypothetical protein
MLFVATITHSINLGIGEMTYTFEAASYLEAVQRLEQDGKLKGIRKLEITTAESLGNG